MPTKKSFLKILIKLIYSEKATKFCEIPTVDLSYVVPVKSTVEILQNFVAFSEYMNFDFWNLNLLLQEGKKPYDFLIKFDMTYRSVLHM